MRAIRVLFLAADPQKNTVALRIDREIRDVRQAIRDGSGHQPIVLESEFAVRLRDLQAAMHHHAPQVVHFSGHGRKDGELVMDDGRRVTGEALAALFVALEGSVRLVVLNACRTHEVARTLSAVVDYVVGMDEVIYDESAAQFSAAFYGALAFGKSVPSAFEFGVSQLQLLGTHESHIPRLWVRSDVAPRPLEPRELPSPVDPSAADAPDRQRNILGDVESKEGIEFIAVDGSAETAGGRALEQENFARSVKTDGKMSFIGRRN
jgi:hypothetical protein